MNTLYFLRTSLVTVFLQFLAIGAGKSPSPGTIVAFEPLIRPFKLSSGFLIPLHKLPIPGTKSFRLSSCEI